MKYIKMYEGFKDDTLQRWYIMSGDEKLIFIFTNGSVNQFEECDNVSVSNLSGLGYDTKKEAEEELAKVLVKKRKNGYEIDHMPSYYKKGPEKEEKMGSRGRMYRPSREEVSIDTGSMNLKIVTYMIGAMKNDGLNL